MSAKDPAVSAVILHVNTPIPGKSLGRIFTVSPIHISKVEPEYNKGIITTA